MPNSVGSWDGDTRAGERSDAAQLVFVLYVTNTVLWLLVM
jgi:hypothetical protein